MLRLGYDAKRLFNNFTGLGNYSRTLLTNLAEYYPEHAYFLFTPKVKLTKETQFFLSNPQFDVRMPKQKWQGPWWRTSGVKKTLVRKKIDLYHGLSHEIPFGINEIDVKSVVTIHDLIFKHYPRQYSYFDRQIYDRKFRYACEHADRIIAISESTKMDIIRFYQIPSAKIQVVYQSCDARFKLQLSHEIIQRTLQQYKLPENFLLFVGSIIERKNLFGVVKALSNIPKERRLPLVVIGKGGAYKQKVIKFLTQNKMTREVLFSDVDNADLPAIYQAASLFLYPSYYEGFGLPIIEALWSRTPVITSRTSSMPEAAGPYSALVHPDNVEEIAHQIELILNDSGLQQQMVDSGIEHAQLFDSEKVTHQLMELYEEVLDG